MTTRNKTYFRLKRTNKKWVAHVALITACIFAVQYSIAQDKPDKHRTRVALECVQTSEEGIILKGYLRARIGRSYTPFAGAKLTFNATLDTLGEVYIGEAVTDDLGYATILYDPAIPESGPRFSYTFEAKFDESDTLRSHSKSVEINRALLELDIGEADSLSQICIATVSAITAEGRMPAEGVPVDLYVKRMLSDLNIGTGETDDQGLVEFDIPLDLPGDITGKLQIIAKVSEDDTYGSLMATTDIPTEIIRDFGIQKQRRALWSSAPPLWMYISFLVLMGIVWGHYLVIVVQLIRIKREGKSYNFDADKN